MPDTGERFEEQSKITMGEAKALIAVILNVPPEEVMSWVILAHTHTGPPGTHQTRSATNVALEAMPKLLLEGISTL